MDVIWSSRAGLFIAGPDTTAQLGRAAGEEAFIGLRFPPGVGPAVLGIAAHELTDRSLPLDALWPYRQVRTLADRLAETRDGTVLDAAAAARLAARGGPDRLAGPLAGWLGAGRSVASAAAAAGLSARQLHRRCQELFGYGPKTLARILRMQRALAMVDAGAPAARAAADAGYADQPHLAREVRALAGTTLGRLRPG
jgi:AraC-like DNA-binding protein